MTNGSRILAVVALLAAAGAGAFYLQTRPAADPAPKAPPPATAARGVPVTVAAVLTKEVPLTLNLVGRAEAWSTVTLRSRIDGQIVGVHYQAGQHIARGQKMVTLDSRALQAQLAAAEANLARDRAQFEKARSDFARYSDLVAKGFVSASQLETYRAAVDSTDAIVKADIAARDLARVQLSYTTITSPMEGVAGAVLVFGGGSVKANDTPLVVVNQVRPIYVTFSVPERMIAQVDAARAGGPMPVAVSVPGTQRIKLTGALSFVDNAVDSTTGTIIMKAKIDNGDEKLTPGQFVEVSIVLRNLKDALVMPSEALQSGPDGNFVYVARPDQTVEVRKVQTVAVAGRELVVEQGLAAGEKVVTDGQLRLTPGARYEARDGRPAVAGGGATPERPPGDAKAAAPAPVAGTPKSANAR